MSSSKDKQERRRLRQEAELERRKAEGRPTRNVVLAAVATFALVGAGAAAIIAAGGTDGGSSSPAAAVRVDTTGLSPELAAHAKDANRVLDSEILVKLEALKGVPVVVNQWASWCPSCKAEFGFFAELADEYRGRVAFVGLDSSDDRGKAEDFLKDHPIPFPSIYDESAAQAASIGGGQSWPTTMFYNAEGERTFVKPGGYTTAQSLDDDIRLYALEGSS